MSGTGSRHRQSRSARSESQDTLLRVEVRVAESWTQVFSLVPQGHPLGCPLPVTFNMIKRQLPPTFPAETDTKAYVGLRA